MGLFSAIVKIGIDTVIGLPVAVVKDIITLGNVTSCDETYIQQKLEQIKKDSEDADVEKRKDK